MNHELQSHNVIVFGVTRLHDVLAMIQAGCQVTGDFAAWWFKWCVDNSTFLKQQVDIWGQKDGAAFILGFLSLRWVVCCAFHLSPSMRIHNGEFNLLLNSFSASFLKFFFWCASSCLFFLPVKKRAGFSFFFFHLRHNLLYLITPPYVEKNSIAFVERSLPLDNTPHEKSPALCYLHTSASSLLHYLCSHLIFSPTESG